MECCLWVFGVWKLFSILEWASDPQSLGRFFNFPNDFCEWCFDRWKLRPRSREIWWHIWFQVQIIMLQVLLWQPGERNDEFCSLVIVHSSGVRVCKESARICEMTSARALWTFLCLASNFSPENAGETITTLKWLCASGPPPCCQLSSSTWSSMGENSCVSRSWMMVLRMVFKDILLSRFIAHSLYTVQRNSTNSSVSG